MGLAVCRQSLSAPMCAGCLHQAWRKASFLSDFACRAQPSCPIEIIGRGFFFYPLRIIWDSLQKNYGLSQCVLYVGRKWTREACPRHGDGNAHGEHPLSAQRGEDSNRMQLSDHPPQREPPTRKGPDPGQAGGLQTPACPAGVMASAPITRFTSLLLPPPPTL